MGTKQKFDGLSEDYDRYRPRYPEEFFRTVAAEISAFPEMTVVDAGAGTGIALEGLRPVLGESARYLAVDVSEDMVDRGREKFPDVRWTVGAAEPFIEGLDAPVQLVVAAQAYQWMDRPRFVAACVRALAPGGLLAVMQNNRDYTLSAFLDAYETLLELHSPGYTRRYRDFDIAGELASGFDPTGGHVGVSVLTWRKRVEVADFVRMAASSTQVRRAVDREGAGFLDRVRALCEAHARDGRLEIAYRSELFLGNRG
ncbi:class I SAM-dependent methyltransferase [Nocardiopsis sp. NPDC050513]|uniref:class I SAM-dependent methyltransferase n=1 Tax=Nocardiopsis sp. NPDC050513 TaxID=3364338 RepID=UPI0037B4EEF2